MIKNLLRTANQLCCINRFDDKFLSLGQKTKWHKEVICESETKTLSCPSDDEKLSIEKAFYGRLDAHTLVDIMTCLAIVILKNTFNLNDNFGLLFGNKFFKQMFVAFSFKKKIWQVENFQMIKISQNLKI